jgi:hypothetical protein
MRLLISGKSILFVLVVAFAISVSLGQVAQSADKVRGPVAEAEVNAAQQAFPL